MRDIKFRCYSSQKEMLYMADIRHMALAEFEMETSIKWMQYTGLKDVNGVDIYEGDVLNFKWLYQDGTAYIEDEWIHGTIEFTSGKFVVRCYSSTFDVSGINQVTFERFWRETYPHAKTDYFKMIGFKVIGNIHEHPELIK